MSSRSIPKDTFEQDELVLCFEPDPMKARVLYDAKVLSVESLLMANKKKIRAYNVHFLGWNASWDRVVPEGYVLKASAEHKSLMHQLAYIAKHTRSNKKRKKLINEVLVSQLGVVPTIDDILNNREPTDMDSSSDESSASAHGSARSVKRAKLDGASAKRLLDYGGEKLKYTDANDSDDSDDGCSADDDNQCDDNEMDTEKGESRVYTELHIPESLKRNLEKDSIYIAEMKKIVSLPAQPNVLQILESFVKHYAINTLCASTDKHRSSSRDKNSCLVEKSIELRKEIADGLRIFFDFALPVSLLYASEQHQYEQVIRDMSTSALNTSQKLQTSSEVHQACVDDMTLQSKPFRNRHAPDIPSTTANGIDCSVPKSDPTVSRSASSHRRSSTAVDHDDAPCSSSKARADAEKSGHMLSTPKTRTNVRLSHHSNDIKQCSDIQTPIDSNDGSRRMTRHMDEAAKKLSSESKKIDVTPITPVQSTVVTSAQSVSASVGRRKGVDNSQSKKDIKQTVTLRAISPTPDDSKELKPVLEPVRASVALPTTHDTVKEFAADSIMSWQLVSEKVKHMYPVTPSAIYGAHHLLRLFVKLPEYLGKMAMSDPKRKLICKQLETFLEFLSNQSDDYFCEASYIDALEH